MSQPEKINQKLLNASKHGDPNEIRSALSKGALIDITDLYGNTPLHLAAHGRHPGCIKLLLEHGASIDPVNSFGSTPLHLSVQHKDNDACVKLLVSAGANVNAATRNKWSALHLIVFSGETNYIDVLVNSGADVNAVDNHGQTPLIVSVIYNRFNHMLALMESGADLDIFGENEHNALTAAAKYDRPEMISSLLNAGANVNACSSGSHWTALQHAVSEKKSQCVRAILRYNPDVSEPHRIDLLSWALNWDHPVIFELLLEHGYRLSENEDINETHLLLAASQGRIETLNTLIEKGTSVNFKTPRLKRSPLDAAARNKHLSCMRRLIEAGADVDAQDFLGSTALNTCSGQLFLDGVALLLSSGARIGIPNQKSPLYQAGISSEDDPYATIDLLLKAGASPDETCEDGRTVLHRIAHSGHTKSLNLLIARGACVDATDSFGKTPLYYAIVRSRLDAASALIDAGANIGLVEIDGKSLDEFINTREHDMTPVKAAIWRRKMLTYTPDRYFVGPPDCFDINLVS